MTPVSARGRLALVAALSTAAFVLPAAPPLFAAGDLCPEAWFELVPTPYDLAILNTGWRIPTTGPWTEVHPVLGQEHPQYQYLDEYPDGLITKVEGFLEHPTAVPWYIAGVGTMLHLTPVDLVPGGDPIPIGESIIAWWPEFHLVREPREDGRWWFIVPDSVLVLAPTCCEWLPVLDHLAGGIVGNDPPTALRLTGPTAPGEAWHQITAKNCGLWVGPNLATPAGRASWGGLKIRYR